MKKKEVVKPQPKKQQQLSQPAIKKLPKYFIDNVPDEG